MKSALLEEPLLLLPSTDEICGDTILETLLLRGYLDAARLALGVHQPGAQICREAFGLGLAGVFAVFAVWVRSAPGDVTAYWVVAGDPPPAVFPLVEAPTPLAAMVHYVDLAEKWALDVQAGAAPAPALQAPATLAHAEEVAAKMRTLRLLVLPALALAATASES